MARIKLHQQIKTEQDVYDLVNGILDMKTSHMFSAGKVLEQVYSCMKGSSVSMSHIRMVLLVEDTLEKYVKQDKFVCVDGVYASGKWREMLINNREENSI